MKFKCIGIILSVLMACSSTTVYCETDDDFSFCTSSVGDVNNDSKFSESDIKSMSGYMIDNETICKENADINSDDTVNIVDLIMLKDYYNMTSVFDAVQQADITSQNGSIPETQVINYKYLDKSYSVEFDSLEQQVLTRLNDFRQRYGVGRGPVFYRGLYACDKAAAAGKNEVFNELRRHFTYRMSYYNTISSTDPDTIVQTLLSNPLNKGSVLTPDYYVSVGHSGSLWVMMTSWLC